MTVKAILKSYKDMQGKQTVFIRIHNGKERKHKATKIKLALADWDKEKGYVRPSHPNYKTLNEKIKREILEIEMNILEGKKKYAGADFFQYCTDCCNDWDKIKRLETLRQHWSEINKIKRFSSVVKIENISPQWLQRYSDYCYSLGNVTNTVWKSIKFIKTIIRKAHKEKIIEDNPFDIFPMPKYTDPQRAYLTEDELLKIEKFSLEESNHETLRDVATWFLFASYSFLRYGDCVRFDKKKHVVSGRIVMRTQKTGSDITIKIHPRLQAILKRLPDRIFTNARMNAYLKAIAAEIELDKDLNFHLSRHSGSVMFLTKGGSMEVLSKLLGHSKLSTTQIYGKITNERLDSEVNKVWG